MLYLEDYLEGIEHLPQEIWDKFTEMRELDLQAQLTKDSQRKKLKDFFARAPTMSRTDRDNEFRSIRAGYDEALSCAGMKTEIAQTMYDKVDRYVRKLDAELHKLKMELEADSPGITEVLEQRALESETRDSQNMKVTKAGDRKVVLDGIGAPVDGVPGQVYGLGQMMGAGALAAAASQAIAATQQLQQGRRTASLKASFDAISGMQDVGVDGTTAVAGGSQDAGRKKSKKQRAPSITNEPPASPSAPSAALGATLLGVDGVLPDWAVDPNEPRYCLCNQVSYGDMVACDNEKECPYEWFHYACVGLTDAPKGKWYCPPCTASMKRRGTRR